MRAFYRGTQFWLAAIVAAMLPLLVAAQVSFVAVERPYDSYQLLDDIPRQQTLYGDLQGFPELFQFTVTATTTIPITLRAIDADEHGPLFSLILVRDESQRGVREISRLAARETTWDTYRDSRTRMLYLAAPTLAPTLVPGTYRLEVSTPDNEGRYQLVFGDDPPRLGYVATWRTIRAIHDFHGYGPPHMLRTSHALLPLLTLLIIVGIFGTWRYARRQRWV